MKGNKKQRKFKKKALKSINYFYFLLEIHFTYFSPIYKDQIILKFINF